MVGESNTSIDPPASQKNDVRGDGLPLGTQPLCARLGCLPEFNLVGLENNKNTDRARSFVQQANQGFLPVPTNPQLSPTQGCIADKRTFVRDFSHQRFVRGLALLLKQKIRITNPVKPNVSQTPYIISSPRAASSCNSVSTSVCWRRRYAGLVICDDGSVN